MMTNEPMPQGEAKVPITRKMCVQAVKQTYREGFPCFYWIGNAMMTVFVVAVACLLFIPPYWPVNLFGVVWLIVNWCLGLGAFFSHVLALFGICNVAKDVLRGKFTRKDTKGQVLYYWFRFTYHSPKMVDKHTYETAQAGEIFYMLSVPGLTYNETVAIYPISQYEWTGNSSKIKDYTRFYAARDQTVERVENTILARRPLTHGRKWKLTGEEIARDLLEERALTKEHVLVAFVATAVLGGGFVGVPNTVDQVLIAGMGGGEIVGILSDKKFGFMPKRFVFQPMHDSAKLRKYILENGGYIERDFTFEDGKFYDVIVGGKADETHESAPYSNDEYEFGRDNLKKRPQAFLKRVKKLLKNMDKYLSVPTLQEQNRIELEKRKEKLQEVLNGETLRDL